MLMPVYDKSHAETPNLACPTKGVTTTIVPLSWGHFVLAYQDQVYLQKKKMEANTLQKLNAQASPQSFLLCLNVKPIF